MKQRYIGFLFAVLALLVGVLLYATTRTSSIFLNQWLGHIYDGDLLRYLQSLDLALPHWMVYSLPDGLWMLALMILVLLVWDFKLHIRSIPWIIMALVTGLLYEIFQGFLIVPGTFDIADLVLIYIAAFFPISFIMIKQYICATN